MPEKLLFHISRAAGIEFVFSSGRHKVLPGHSHQTTATISLVRSGLVSFDLENRKGIFKTGDIYLTPANRAHQAEYLEAYDLVSMCLNLDTSATLRSEDLMTACDDQLREMTERGLLTSGEGMRLFTSLARYGADLLASPKPSPPLSIWLQTRLEAEDSDGIQTPEPGDRFGFIRRFRREMGATPHQYILRSKVRRAKDLLAQPLPITSVALEAGFYDQSHFDRHFKKVVGLTPRDYRKACRYY